MAGVEPGATKSTSGGLTQAPKVRGWEGGGELAERKGWGCYGSNVQGKERTPEKPAEKPGVERARTSLPTRPSSVRGEFRGISARVLLNS